MATTIKFLQALDKIWNSGALVLENGTLVYPSFGNYLDCVGGETPVFMTLGTNEFDLIVFSSTNNPTMTIEDDGRLSLLDIRGRKFTYGLRDLPPPGPSRPWPYGTPDRFEP